MSPRRELRNFSTRYQTHLVIYLDLLGSLIIAAPDDGLPMLHLMAPHLFKFFKGHQDHLIAAHSWVRLQVHDFERSGNKKLYQRYVRLLRSFDAYAPTPNSPSSPTNINLSQT
jgi:hypothetical protein